MSGFPEPIAELLALSLEKTPSQRLPSLAAAMELIDRATSELTPSDRGAARGGQ